MIFLSPGNKWSIPTILDEIKNKKSIEFLYRDELGRIQKGKQHKKLMFKTLLRCGTKCTHCQKEGLHFELSSCNYLRIATNDGFLNTEHIIPQSLGGTNIDYNVTTFCDICNTAKGNDLLVPKKIKPTSSKPSKNKNSPVTGKPKLCFSRFVKDLLLTITNNNHSEMHQLFSELYKQHNQFIIEDDSIPDNVLKLNNFLKSKNLSSYINEYNFTGYYK